MAKEMFDVQIQVQFLTLVENAKIKRNFIQILNRILLILFGKNADILDSDIILYNIRIHVYPVDH